MIRKKRKYEVNGRLQRLTISLESELDMLSEGIASQGETIFLGAGGCHACHSLEQGEQKVGPSLAGVASCAETAKPGSSAVMCLYESIVYPKEIVVSGYHGGIMPADYKQRLSLQEIADLIAFLITR